MNKQFTFSVAPLSRLVFGRRMPVLLQDLQSLYVEFAPEGSFERDVASYCTEENGLFVGDALERDLTNQEKKHDPALLRLYAIRLAYAKLVQSKNLFAAGRPMEAWDALIDAHFWHGSAVTLGPLEVLAASMQTEARKRVASVAATAMHGKKDPMRLAAKLLMEDIVNVLPAEKRFPSKSELGRQIFKKLKAEGFEKPVKVKTLVEWLNDWLTPEQKDSLFADVSR